jgi:hypothetical protein
LEDRFFSPYVLEIGGDERTTTPRGEWVDLEIRWDGDMRSATATVNGQPLATLPPQREGLPISYLRIRPLSNESEKGCLLIDDVQVEVTP